MSYELKPIDVSKLETTAAGAINHIHYAIAMYAFPGAAIERAVNEAVASAEQRGAAGERKRLADSIRSDEHHWPGERSYIAMLLRRLEAEVANDA